MLEWSGAGRKLLSGTVTKQQGALENFTENDEKAMQEFQKMFAPKAAFLLLPFFHGFADSARG